MIRKILALTFILFNWVLLPAIGDGDDLRSYESFEDDPSETRIYTLDNGLKVYLSVNKDEPRIQSYIAVRAGSKNDPAETTGLAHYLEHMLFKGTSLFGTTNFKDESRLIAEISILYEMHRKEADEEKKREIYKKIDQKSGEAAKLAIPNEYDKMISSLGASGTNAWTSKEQTVYTNNIPANELERWMRIESERFQELVLRLFHTELEAVYEEFNMSQDRDGSKVWKEFFGAMFPTNTYGTQTTIGEGEHLKNPSMENIHAYFNRYYVPNNIAICLAGDLDPKETIGLIEKYFGDWERKDMIPYKPAIEKPIDGPIRVEVTGLEAESVMLGFRLPGSNSHEVLMTKIIDGVLSNGAAGLIDLSLVQKQKVLDAGSFLYDLEDYSAFILSGDPREGQSLEEVEQLLLGELQKIKDGDFEEWLMDAVINDGELSQVRQFETNRGRASAYVDAFTMNLDWGEYVNQYKQMSRIRKSDLVSFANKVFNDNYVVVYKKQGEANVAGKVDKPQITPIEANRESTSRFVNVLNKMDVPRIEPIFLDYKKDIIDSKLESKVPFSYIKNKNNDLFELYYILDMGTDNDPLIGLAIDYLPFLGTEEYSADILQQEFFKLGLDFDVFSSQDRVYVKLSGLGSSLSEGVKLFESLLANVEPNPQALEDMVEGILKQRSDAKSNKRTILWTGMYNYARYGSTNPFTDKLSESELRALTPETLIGKLQNLTSFEHRIFYYGKDSQTKVAGVLNRLHKVNKKFKSYPDAKDFEELATKKAKVYFVHYDMVQAQVVMMSKGEQYDKKIVPMARMFNEYFGSGLSSIVFQEIRETRALAYSAFASYSTPTAKDKSHYLRAYVATQVDKMPEAIGAMSELLNDMPRADQQFEAARESVLKRIETDRVTKSSIFWNRESALRRGLTHDFRENIYNVTNDASFVKLEGFFQEYVAGQPFTYLVIGDKSKVDLDLLKSLGDFEELGLEEIFGY
ncbi:MAG: zinc protease [Limisphaerales bacterium]|jgi:zinc protease